MAIFQIIAGFVLLGIGGDVLVRGAVGVAGRLGVSTLFIGLVLVGFGTSVPELATSINASVSGSPGIAIGNVVGSNIANILLILGVTATITTVTCSRASFKRDAPVLALATLLCTFLALSGTFGRVTGLISLCALFGYIFYTYKTESRSHDKQAEVHERQSELVEPPTSGLVAGLLLTLAGIVGVMAGAVLIVNGSVSVARLFNVPETVIGLTIVAFGTSLPELAASISAARKKQTDLAYGNIIGSNLFNILGILGASAVVAPMRIPPNLVKFDVWIMCGATALLFFFAWTGRSLSRKEGIVFLAGYVGYLVFLGVRS